MEKIQKEELIKLCELKSGEPLSDEFLEMVTGGLDSKKMGECIKNQAGSSALTCAAVIPIIVQCWESK